MKDKNSQHLEDLKEYQSKQYLSGYYTGKNIHPLFKSRGKITSYFFYSLSLMFLITFVINIIISYRGIQTDYLSLFLDSIFIGTSSFLTLLAGNSAKKK